MKVFISWSGDTSLQMAQVIHGWLPSVIQAAEPYMSSEDISKGARWSQEIAGELESSDFGIICVTAANVSEPWLNFEAGALSNSFGETAYVVPFLFNLRPSAITGPLSQFQATGLDKADVYRLVESINQGN